MPVRVMGYDYASYEWGVRRQKEQTQRDGIQVSYGKELADGQCVAPVITLVLYFGMEPWSGPRTLLGMVGRRKSSDRSSRITA